MRIVVAGDLVINQEYDINKVDCSIIELFRQSDYNIVNLEAPVTDSNSLISKTGPNIKSNEKSTFEVLKLLEIDLVTLANNHILDFGHQGVEDTLKFCKKHCVSTVGAGLDLGEASEIFYLNTTEGVIAVINFAENEWTSATLDSAGSNPMDFIDNTKQIRVAKDNADFTIVIVHGGNEYNEYPSPRMVRQYRFYADSGVDAVIGHHTHCFSGFEVYNNTPIIYGLGNFLFTMNSSREKWFTGIIASLKIKKNHPIQFEVIPVKQSKENFSLFLPDREESKVILEQINQINEVISSPILLEDKWQEFIVSVEGGFIKTTTPMAGFNNRYFKAILYRSGLYRYLLNQKYLKESLNRIRCEAHYDVIKAILKKNIKK